MPLTTESSAMTFKYDPDNDAYRALRERMFGDDPPTMKLAAKCDHCHQLITVGTVTGASQDGNSSVSVRVEATDGEHRLWLAHQRGECLCTCIGMDEKPGCNHGHALIPSGGD